MNNIALWFCLSTVFAAGCTAVSKDMEINYDGVSGFTSVISSPVVAEVENAGANSWRNSSVGSEKTLGTMSFTVSAACEGRTLSAPKDVILAFSAVNKEWTFLKDHSLVLIVDDERIDMGNCERQASTSVASGPVQCLEIMSKRIEFSFLKRLAYAKSIDGRLGETNFFTEFSSRGPLRAFVERLEAKPVQP